MGEAFTSRASDFGAGTRSARCVRAAGRQLRELAGPHRVLAS